MIPLIWLEVSAFILSIPYVLIYIDGKRFEKQVGKENVGVPISERFAVYSAFFTVPILGLEILK